MGLWARLSPFSQRLPVEAEKALRMGSQYPPSMWTRLWKLHGSVAWHLVKANDGSMRVIRRNDFGTSEQLMIFPSRDKYAESRKLPFLTFQDRFRKFLAHGEVVLLVSGYSFSDEHLNEIILEGLRTNSRLAITALAHDHYSPSDRLNQYVREHTNFTIFWPDKAIMGGTVFDWTYSGSPANAGRDKLFWDIVKSQWILGDFKHFSLFLESFGSRLKGGRQGRHHGKRAHISWLGQEGRRHKGVC